MIPLGRTVGLPANGAVSNLSAFPESVATLGKELRNGGYDIVHVHEPNAPFVSWFAAEAARQPTVATFHTYSTSWLGGTILRNVGGARRLYSKLSARIAVSEAAEWTARRYYGGLYSIVPNGVDLSAARPDPGRPRGPLNILFVGRAEGRKGLPVLLRAFEALRLAGVDARLTVAGATGEEVAPLLLDPEGVEIAGRVSEEEKWRLLGEADLLCAPSLGGESFGMVLTRAFACATPVVASDISGYRGVMEPEAGRLVPPDEPSLLADAVVALLADEPAREQLGRAAREIAQEKYSWDGIAQRLAEIYASLAGSRSAVAA
jgi:phosphatidylinositol alpha-mannosyltransferase